MKAKRFMAMMIAAVACLGAFTACGDDDDNNGGSSSSKSVKAVQATLKMYVSPDIVKYIDVKGTYKDLAGNSYDATLSTTTEKVTVSVGFDDVTYELCPLTATYSFTSVPAVFTMNVTYTAKSTPTDKIDMVVVPRTSGVTTYSDGTTQNIGGFGTGQTVAKSGVAPDKFEQYVAAIQKACGSVTMTINADGSGI